MEWEGVLITLMHRSPRSGGARVVVTQRGRHVVSSSSHEGMAVDDPNIQGFLVWARDYYRGAEFREVAAPATEEVSTMPEIHAARCDAPGCQSQENLKMASVTAPGYGTAYTFSLPSSGWQRIEGRLLCSWACVAAYAEQRAQEV